MKSPHMRSQRKQKRLEVVKENSLIFKELVKESKATSIGS